MRPQVLVPLCSLSVSEPEEARMLQSFSVGINWQRQRGLGFGINWQRTGACCQGRGGKWEGRGKAQNQESDGHTYRL